MDTHRRTRFMLGDDEELQDAAENLLGATSIENDEGDGNRKDNEGRTAEFVVPGEANEDSDILEYNVKSDRGNEQSTDNSPRPRRPVRSSLPASLSFPRPPASDVPPVRRVTTERTPLLLPSSSFTG